MRTKQFPVLTSKGMINAHWVIDLPYEEARHLIGLERVEPVDPLDGRRDRRPPGRQNAALSNQLER